MTWESDILGREAGRTTDRRTAALLRRMSDILRRRRPAWQEELISRMCVGAAFIQELEIDRVDKHELLATLAKESGCYRLARRAHNSDGSNDLGPCMINSIHRGMTDEDRLSWYRSLRYVRDVLIPLRLKKGQHPLADFNAFTSGDYREMLPFAAEAWRRAGASHPKAWP